MISRQILACSLLFTFSLTALFAQRITVSGTVVDPNNRPLDAVSVFISALQTGTVTNSDGYFELQLTSFTSLELIFSSIGYETKTERITLREGIQPTIRVILTPSVIPIEEITITERSRREGTLTRIDIRSLDYLPGVSRSVESVIQTMPGVTSRNELSSQYSVRGGNFDENLVYINGLEIYRPLLIRSGQQEGLSIVNPDMVSSVSFSAGGFDARYGDKMSSVLDIRYRRPVNFAGSASASLLGGNIHLEGASDNQKFTQISSFRYKTNAYLLGTLETKGEYNPAFTDFQTFLTWKITGKSELSFIGNYSENKYNFIPETRETTFGTFQNSYGLKVYFEGQELNRFRTLFGGLVWEYTHNNATRITFSSSAFDTRESETFDVLGQYLLNQLDNQLGSTSFGDSIMNIGIGGFLHHARNFLDARVLNMAHTGVSSTASGTLHWGASLSRESFINTMNEWKLLDSAGYSIPYSSGSIIMNERINSDYSLENFKVSAYLMHIGRFSFNSSYLEITAGLRTLYLSQTEGWYLSPRIGFTYYPGKNPNLHYFLSGGVYYQPAFYKEMRDFYGNLNPLVEPQRAFHVIAGSDYQFWWWNRPFRFVSEVYYKNLKNIVPYVTDNVRILYTGDNYAEGYAAGMDFKINGEFVKGLESWASLSFMRTRERISPEHTGSTPFTEVNPGEFVSRPTDQLVNFSMFFQDFLPSNPNYKVHLQMVFASSLPFHPPQKDVYGTIFRMPSYKRVDIGFSRELTSINRGDGTLNRLFKNMWLGAEIFNLLGIKNTASYLWINSVAIDGDVPVNMAVPNYLSGRLLNVKLSAKF